MFKMKELQSIELSLLENV